MMAQCINVISPQCPVCTASPSAVHWSGRSFATLWYPAHSFSTRFLLPGIQNWWSSWYCWLYPQFCSWIPVWRRYNCIPLRSNPPLSIPGGMHYKKATYLSWLFRLYPLHRFCNNKNPMFVGQIPILMNHRVMIRWFGEGIKLTMENPQRYLLCRW